MPCCGKKRAQARQTQPARRMPETAGRTAAQHRPERNSSVFFQYLGRTGLTVIGPRTRKRYRFDNPGAVVAVDPRDQRALRAVTILRQVRKPAQGTGQIDADV